MNANCPSIQTAELAKTVQLELFDQVYVSLAWSLQVLVEHNDLSSLVGQTWRLLIGDRVRNARVMMLASSEHFSCSCTQIYLLDQDSGEQYSLCISEL